MVSFKHACICLALIAASTTMQAASPEPVTDSQGFELHLPGYAPKLLSENQSRLSWHFMNEASQVLSTGVLIAAGYSLGNKIDPVKYPVQAILSTAHIAMDWFLSNNLTDFAVRQMTQVPLLVWRWYTRNTFSSWMNSLIQESPLLLIGAWEMWIQSQIHLPQGTKTIHIGGREGAFHIQFSNIGYPHLIFQFNSEEPQRCQFTEPADTLQAYHQHLKQLSCTAYQNSISKLEIQPQGSESNPRYAITVRAIKNNGETQSHNIAVDTQSNSQLVWLTDVLNKTPEKTSVGIALSPLAEKVLITLTTALEDDSGQQPPTLSTDDLTVTVVSGKSMVVAGLGDGSYLLSDHTDSQGLALPELWLGAEPVISRDQAANALKVLEERRRPGPEYGAWRLLAAARSIAHRTVLNQTVNWLTYKEGRNFTRKGYTKIEDNTVLTEPEAKKVLAGLKGAKGNKVLVTGVCGSGRGCIANGLIGKNVFEADYGPYISPEFESYISDRDDCILLPLTLTANRNDAFPKSVKTEILADIDQAFFIQNADTSIQNHQDEALNQLVKLFPSQSEADKKITLIFNSLNPELTEDRFFASLTKFRSAPQSQNSPFMNKAYRTAFYNEGNAQHSSDCINELRKQLQGSPLIKTKPSLQGL